MKKYYKIVLLLILGTSLQAQQELSERLMSHLNNFSKVNPSYFPQDGLMISLPSVGLSLMHTGPSFQDLYEKQSTGKYQIRGDQALEAFDSHNLFGGAFSADLLGVAFTKGENSFSLNYGMYANGSIDYTADAAKLLLKGNGEFVGQTLSIGPEISVNVYDKIGLGYARKFGDWSVGARMNFLFGRKSLSTQEHYVNLTTSSDYYALDLQTDYVLRSSDFLNIDSETNKVSLGEMTYKPGLGKNGKGYGLDFGFTYQVDKQLSIFSSVTNIGSILWKENTSIYSSQTHMVYEGVQIQSLANLDTASLSGMLDSIQQFVGLEESEGTFKTVLSPAFMGGGSLKISDKTTFNGVIVFNEIMGNFLPAVGLGVQRQLAPWAKVGGSLSYQNKRINHIGLNTTVKFGPVQMFMATDNILTFIAPRSSGTMHFRAGMSVMFGKVARQKTIYGLG